MGMLPKLALALLLLAPPPAVAQEVWHATRTLLPGDIVRSDDVALRTPVRPVPEALPAATNVVGLEVRRRIFDGRVLTERDIGPRTSVKANTPVEVIWKSGTMSLAMAGRALEAGAIGDEVRVLNPMTARTIRGVVVGDAMVELRSVP